MNNRTTITSGAVHATCSFLLFVFVNLVFAFVMGCSHEVVNSAIPKSTRPNSDSDASSYQSALADVAFIDGAYAWATDRSGTALYHTHTGASLETTAVNFGGKPLISFLDTKTGFAFAHSVEAGRLWRTSDGGKNWHKVTEFDQKDKDFQLTSIRQLHFVDAQRAWLIDVFGIWRTTDGGAHWEQVFKMAAHPEAKELMQGAFSGSERALVATENGIYLSMDGGKSWKPTNNNTGFTAIYLLDEHSGWVWSDVLERTDDGGNSWRELYKLQSRIRIMSTQFINKEEGWATGVEVPESLGSLVRNTSSSQWHGVLLHTTNGGKNWDHASAPADEAFHRVAFSNSKTGWLLGKNRLYRTIDGGSTWTTVLELQTP